MVLTSFFDFIQAPSMRISLILHLNFAHIKPQQPNPVILVTILDATQSCKHEIWPQINGCISCQPTSNPAKSNEWVTEPLLLLFMNH